MRTLTVTAIVTTRGRPTHIVECVRSLLASEALEVIVVDQSADNETEHALAALGDRLRYVRSTTIGSSSARNVGAAIAHSDVLAFTDDDCRVPANWIGRIASLFASEERVTLICGRVSVPIGAEGLAASFLRRMAMFALIPQARPGGG